MSRRTLNLDDTLYRYLLAHSVHEHPAQKGLREASARRLIPPDLQRSFDETTRTVESSLFRLGHELGHFDTTLVSALEKSRAKMLFQLSKVQSKAARESMRRDARASNDALYLSGLLYPHKHLQERFYSILPFLAKHGLSLIDHLYEQINLVCPDHQVVVI